MRKNRRAWLLIMTVCVLCVEVSEARLLRRTGRSSPSFNDGQLFVYARADQLNAVGITPDAFENDPGIDFFPSRSPIDQNRGVAAVPGGTGGCIKGFDDNDRIDSEDFIFELEQRIQEEEGGNNDPGVIAGLESEILAERAKFSNDPCSWEFEEGERLELVGDFSMFFDIPEITYDVSWNISGEGLAFSLPGELITADFTSPDGDSFARGEGVRLSAEAPAGLAVGNYFLTVGVTLNAPGRFFFTEDDGAVDFINLCEPNPAYESFISDPANFEDGDLGNPLTVEAEGRIPDIDICGYQTVDFNDEEQFAPTSFFSEVETFTIVAATNGGPGNPAPVSGPSSALCSLLGLLMLWRRRRA